MSRFTRFMETATNFCEKNQNACAATVGSLIGLSIAFGLNKYAERHIEGFTPTYTKLSMITGVLSSIAAIKEAHDEDKIRNEFTSKTFNFEKRSA